MTTTERSFLTLAVFASTLFIGRFAEAQTKTITVSNMVVNNGNNIPTNGGPVTISATVATAYINNNTSVIVKITVLNKSRSMGANPVTTTISNTVTVSNNGITNTSFNCSLPMGFTGDDALITYEVSTDDGAAPTVDSNKLEKTAKY